MIPERGNQMGQTETNQTIGNEYFGVCPQCSEVRQLQRKRSNRLLEHVDAAINPSDGGEANLSSLSKNSCIGRVPCRCT
jgi:hypothetical protein